MVRIFERLGHTVDFCESIVCCGQPAFNAGYWQEAREIAADVVGKVRSAEVIVVPSGSCAAMLKVFYSQLFSGYSNVDAAIALGKRVFEFSTFLVDELGITDLGSRFPGRVTFHDGCHGLRELGVRRQPRALLERVSDLTLVEMEDQTNCCGFGGTFAVKFPMISTAMGEAKCAAALETGAEYIVSNDSSCLMHLQGLLRRQGKPLKTIHLAEVLANF
jgi:L-lactate dehydrogenase complex protein LldE